MASQDLLRLVNNLWPQAGGEDPVRLRTAVVDSVNADGTLDIILSGVIVNDIPKLGSVSAAVDDVVFVAAYRGALLVIGDVSSSDDVTFSQTVIFDDDIIVTGNAVIGGNLTVNGDVSVSNDLNVTGNVDITGELTAGNMVAGVVTITPTANTPTSITWTYGKTLPTPVRALVTPFTSVPGSQVIETSVGSAGTTSVLVYIYRTNTTGTLIYCWAVGNMG